MLERGGENNRKEKIIGRNVKKKGGIRIERKDRRNIQK